MWQVELRPEIKKELRDPETFATGLTNVYTGLVVAMSGVLIMLVLFLQSSEHMLAPSALMAIGLGLVGWGEWQKYKSK